MAQFGEWMPVKKETPKDYQIVLISFTGEKSKNECIELAWMRNNGLWSDGERINGTVKAWMPLPEPYKEA